jgi:hypothetical protein
MRATAGMSRVCRRNADQYPSTSTRCFAPVTRCRLKRTRRLGNLRLNGDVDLRRALATQNAGEHQRLTGHRAPSSRQLPVQRRRRDAEALRHLFKIDYYDASMEFGSEDPADLSKTTRVLTIMLAEDWRGEDCY